MERPNLTRLPSLSFLKTLYDSSASPTVIDLYEDSLTGLLLILKRLRKSRIFTAYQTESALREIHIHSMLNHPNIVNYYDSAETSDEFHLLMEYIPRSDYFTERIEVVTSK
jgi:serine/threonine protein kinase